MQSKDQRCSLIVVSLLALLLTASAQAQQVYRITPLNFGTPNTAVKPYINNVGQVIATGSSTYLYDIPSNTSTNLGNLLYVVGLNDSGQIVTNDTAPALEPLFITGGGMGSGALYQFSIGNLSQVASLGFYPTGINNLGQVSGTMSIDSVDWHYSTILYDPQTSQTTTVSMARVSGGGGGTFYFSAGINDSGVLAGMTLEFAYGYLFGATSTPLGPYVDNMVLYGYNTPTYNTNATISQLYNCVTPTAINNNGDVVGYWSNATLNGFPPYHAYLSNNTNLGTLGSGLNSYAFALNDSGTVVGSSDVDTNSPPTEHAFLYQNGQMTDLNSLIAPNTGWTLNSALAINNGGEIVGIGTVNGVSSYFLLTTLPLEPIHSPGGGHTGPPHGLGGNQAPTP